MGTRDRIMSRLALAGEVRDGAGMASTVLAAEVGYPGSSIAFAQLLSGMERSGLIVREVRGKRTYRIAAVAGASTAADTAVRGRPGRPARPAPGPGQLAPREAATALPGPNGGRQLAAAASADFDYDELARRLLVQVIRRLASVPGEGHAQAASAGPAGAALEQTVAGLEQELASVRTLHGALTAENARLREQLRAARHSLALAQDRADSRPVADQLDPAEMGVLERLLAAGKDGGREGTGTG